VQPYNPYQAPHAQTAGAAPAAWSPAGGVVPATIVEALRQTRPWVIFLSVLGFLGSGAMVLGGIFIMITGFAASDVAGASPLGFITPFLGLVYILLAAVYIVPSILLWRFGASIGQFLLRSDMETLSDTIVRQKAFWRFVGIFTVVLMAIYFLAIIAGVIAGIVAASSAM
jgi:hypothetical protein